MKALRAFLIVGFVVDLLMAVLATLSYGVACYFPDAPMTRLEARAMMDHYVLFTLVAGLFLKWTADDCEKRMAADGAGSE